MDEETLQRALLMAHQEGNRKAADAIAEQIIQLRAQDPQRKWAQGMREKYEHGYKKPVPMGEGVARSALAGSSFRFGDEATAALAATAQPIVSDQDTGMSWRERYDAYVARERGRQKQFEQEHPVISTTAEIAGAIPTAAAMPGFSGQSMLGRVAAGAATGGYQGAIYGAGMGEGAEDRGRKALGYGVLAGLLGGVAPAVGAGARNATNYFLNRGPAREVGMTRPTFDMLQRTMIADDLAGRGAQNIRRAGPDAMLADAGPSGARLLDTAMQRAGPAAGSARQAIEQRASRANQTITGALDDAFGRPAGVRRTETALRRGTQALRRDAYDEAYEQAINYAGETGQRIENIIRERIPASALRRANELMRARGERSRQILFNVADDGTITYERLPDVRQIDYITRGLNEVAERAAGQGKLGGTTPTGLAYEQLSGELRRLTREAVPAYANALDTAAEPIRARQALLLGQRALSSRMTRDELQEAVGRMHSAAERSYVAQGIRSQIDDALANVQRAMTDPNMDAREAMKAVKMLSSRASREKVATVIGDDAAERLFNSIDQATAGLDLRVALRDNSATFARLAMDETAREQLEGGLVNSIRNANYSDVLKWPVQVLADRTPAARAQALDRFYGEVADVLTGPRGQQAIDVFNRMQQAAPNPQIAARYGRLAELIAGRNAPVAVPIGQARQR